MNRTTQAIACMAFGMAVIPMIDVFAKFLGQQNVPVLQSVWARFFFGALFILPFAWKVDGAAILRTVHVRTQLARAGFLIGGTTSFFQALNYLPIADTLAIYFVQPIIVTALSPVFLGEKVGFHRWTSVAIGFLGVLIIIRPGLQAFNLGVVFALAAGFCSACYMMLTRHITQRVDPMVTTFQTSAMGAIAVSILLPFAWKTVDSSQLLMFVGIGFFATLGHYFVSRAYQLGEASMVSPLGYLEMVTSSLLGWYFFGSFPDGWTFVGVAVLIACAIYISVNERRGQAA